MLTKGAQQCNMDLLRGIGCQRYIQKEDYCEMSEIWSIPGLKGHYRLLKRIVQHGHHQLPYTELC